MVHIKFFQIAYRMMVHYSIGEQGDILRGVVRRSPKCDFVKVAQALLKSNFTFEQISEGLLDYSYGEVAWKLGRQIQTKGAAYRLTYDIASCLSSFHEHKKELYSQYIENNGTVECFGSPLYPASDNLKNPTKHRLYGAYIQLSCDWVARTISDVLRQDGIANTIPAPEGKTASREILAETKSSLNSLRQLVLRRMAKLEISIPLHLKFREAKDV